MDKSNKRVQQRKLGILMILTVLSCILFLTLNVNMKYWDYAMSIRIPKIIAILLTAFCIGLASILFQSVINNHIVTPCLLGMNSLYILLHTLVIFLFGSNSVVFQNKQIAFTIDLMLMSLLAIIIYGFMFQKMKGNVLYILLTGTVMASLFESISSTIQRVIDPNEYLILQTKIIASFSRVNAELIPYAIVIVILILAFIRKELKVLDVLTLGKHQAINLGVDYERAIRKLLVAVTLLITVATALVGPISFLGLILANLSRQLFKTYRHRVLIPGSILIGMVVLLVGQAFIEQVLSYSTTIAVFINIFGGTYFLYLLLHDTKKKSCS